MLFVVILGVAAFTRLWRLGTPDVCYFDEVYFPTTGAEILHTDFGFGSNSTGINDPWQFYGHENTHPPLSKELMAVGEGIFGHQTNPTGDNKCWPATGDFSARKSDAGWQYSPFGWRFFGALAGIGSVIFLYLIGKKLFQSEVAGLAAAFFLTVDGLAFAQARIATPDTYVLFFLLASVYFLLSDRFLLSGVFFGASVACKWTAAFTIVPIVVYFIWRFLEEFRRTNTNEDLRRVERALLGGMVLLILGGLVLAAKAEGFVTSVLDVATQRVSFINALTGKDALPAFWAAAGLIPAVLGLLIIVGAVFYIVGAGPLRSMARGRLYVRTAVVFPVFFLMVPLYVYALTYIPMFLNGHSLHDAIELNRAAFDFHTHLKATHPWQAPWNTWPIDARPVFFYQGSGNSKIYNLGNPIVFWLGIGALVFALWQGLRFFRAKVSAGRLALSGRIESGQAPFLFVVLGYLGLWLPWATQPRIMFLYHYLNALSFLVLALGYVVHWLWYNQSPYGRHVAIGILAVSGLTFIYFYPHLAAVDVPGWLDKSYYWFDGVGPNKLMNWN